MYSSGNGVGVDTVVANSIDYDSYDTGLYHGSYHDTGFHHDFPPSSTILGSELFRTLKQSSNLLHAVDANMLKWGLFGIRAFGGLSSIR